MDGSICGSIQRSKSFVELEVPTVLPQTLCALYVSDLRKTNLMSMYDVHGKGMLA